MLFNLSCQRQFPNLGTDKAIRCGSGLGPCFDGGGSVELAAYNEPFNGDRMCYSHADGLGYCIPVDDSGTNMLTNS
jgi:hypothetical protein